MEMSEERENQILAGLFLLPLDLGEFKNEQGRWTMYYDIDLTKGWLSPLG